MDEHSHASAASRFNSHPFEKEIDREKWDTARWEKNKIRLKKDEVEPEEDFIEPPKPWTQQ